jgi:DNA-binding response OmpR family regulator
MLKQRILLVEDDPDRAEVMVTVLREEGYVVDLAATLAQAQERLAIDRYAVVIADWKLPDGDGTLIAEWGSTLGAKTMVMSGYLREMPGGRAEQHLTLAKPFRANRLLEAVHDCIKVAA